MFTTYGAHNYRSSEGLLVWYEQQFKYFGTTLAGVLVTRRATKRYAYLDMTYAAATACKNAEITLYTRSYRRDEFVKTSSGNISMNEVTVTEVGAQIATTQNDCGSWNVEVAVSEIDTKAIARTDDTFHPQPASLFTYASSRTYDEQTVKTTQGLATWGSTNRRVEADLAVTYAAEKVEAMGVYVYRRYATKRFAYIGMCQQTAEKCAAAKRAQYSREYDVVMGDPYATAMNKREIQAGASIALRHDKNAWNVVVDINETDVKYATLPQNPATFFTTENARPYDTGEIVKLESVTAYSETTGGVNAEVIGSVNIEGKALRDCTFYYKVNDETNWHAAEMTWYDDAGIAVIPNEPYNDIWCKLTCDDSESDVIAAEFSLS